MKECVVKGAVFVRIVSGSVVNAEGRGTSSSVYRLHEGSGDRAGEVMAGFDHMLLGGSVNIGFAAVSRPAGDRDRSFQKQKVTESRC
jgi:hypothetical protein